MDLIPISDSGRFRWPQPLIGSVRRGEARAGWTVHPKVLCSPLQGSMTSLISPHIVDAVFAQFLASTARWLFASALVAIQCQRVVLPAGTLKDVFLP